MKNRMLRESQQVQTYKYTYFFEYVYDPHRLDSCAVQEYRPVQVESSLQDYRLRVYVVLADNTERVMFEVSYLPETPYDKSDTLCDPYEERRSSSNRNAQIFYIRRPNHII